MTTISTFIHHAVTLGGAGYTGPLTITTQGGINPATAGQTALYIFSGVANASVLNNGNIYGRVGNLTAQTGRDGGMGILRMAVPPSPTTASSPAAWVAWAPRSPAMAASGSISWQPALR